jgi:hypothetical protein
MKFPSLTGTLIVIACFSSQCSQTSERVDGESASNSASKIQSPSVVKNDDELKRRYQVMGTEIKRASEKLAVENLRDSIHDKDEIRVWVGFGLTYPRCFTLRFVQEERQATYLTIRTVRRGAALEKVEGVVTKTPLDIPKSGWDEFEKFLKSQGIDSPIRLSRESSQFIPSPDVQIIAIEVKYGAAYSMVFFNLDNKAEDAQKALSVCRRIEQEFTIEMYCGDPASTQ